MTTNVRAKAIETIAETEGRFGCFSWKPAWQLADDFVICEGVRMGTGGSRSGAGRPAWHVKTEHCQSLDMRRWKRQGCLRDGYSGAWRWTDTYSGEETGSIGYRVSCTRR